MQFLAINTSGNTFPAVLLGKQRACVGIGGFPVEGLRSLSLVFTCSLVSRASTSFLIVSNHSLIFHTSSVEFRATCSQISLGSLDIIIGINKLPYCSGDTPNEASPRV